MSHPAYIYPAFSHMECEVSRFSSVAVPNCHSPLSRPGWGARGGGGCAGCLWARERCACARVAFVVYNKRLGRKKRISHAAPRWRCTPPLCPRLPEVPRRPRPPSHPPLPAPCSPPPRSPPPPPRRERRHVLLRGDRLCEEAGGGVYQGQLAPGEAVHKARQNRCAPPQRGWVAEALHGRRSSSPLSPTRRPAVAPTCPPSQNFRRSRRPRRSASSSWASSASL